MRIEASRHTIVKHFKRMLVLYLANSEVCSYIKQQETPLCFQNFSLEVRILRSSLTWFSVGIPLVSIVIGKKCFSHW